MTNVSELSIIIIWNYYYINSLCNQVLLLEAMQENLIFGDFQLYLQNKEAWVSFVLSTSDTWIKSI